MTATTFAARSCSPPPRRASIPSALTHRSESARLTVASSFATVAADYESTSGLHFHEVIR